MCAGVASPAWVPADVDSANLPLLGPSPYRPTRIWQWVERNGVCPVEIYENGKNIFTGGRLAFFGETTPQWGAGKNQESPGGDGWARRADDRREIDGVERNVKNPGKFLNQNNFESIKIRTIASSHWQAQRESIF